MNESDYKTSVAGTAVPEHIQAATRMANEIVESYDPTKQNQMILHIFELVRERRISELTLAEEKFNYLKKAFEDLPVHSIPPSPCPR